MKLLRLLIASSGSLMLSYEKFLQSASLVVLLGLVGCDSPFELTTRSNLVHVFATHHATPAGGVFPDFGDEEQPRVFQNDTGWRISLLEAYIVVNNVTLIACSGKPRPLEMYWGPCPEDITNKDLETVTVAGAEITEGQYCSLVVEYGPYHAPNNGDQHPPPSNGKVVGHTIFLSGIAEKGPDAIGFELKSAKTVSVQLDISSIEGNGTPLNVVQENFPDELTVSKAYDRFFDGIDFLSFDQSVLEDRLGDILAEQTRVSLGTIVQTQ